MSSRPAIVVVAYNRPESLNRLLKSISTASYDTYYPDIIISIDFSSEFIGAVSQVAEDFFWKGQKKIIKQPKNLGLKQHVLTCGDLTKQYGAIIMLEDDLIVSPKFYQFAVSTLSLIDNNPEVAQVSLYHATFNEAAMVPFEALKSSSDFFLMQVPCSWGQTWTQNQWESFRNWYKENERSLDFNKLPDGIIKWSENSWKKPYFLYLKETNRYVLYPYVSFSMNMKEEGTNISKRDHVFSNSLALDFDDNLFVIKESIPKYDDAFMIEPNYLVSVTTELNFKDVHIDFFGSKLHAIGDEELVFTLLPAKNKMISFGLDLKPIELNIIYKTEGEELSLVRKKDIIHNQISMKVMEYLYPIPKWYYSYFQEPLKERLIKTINFLIKKGLK